MTVFALSAAFAALAMFPATARIAAPPPTAPRTVPALNPGVGREVAQARSAVEAGRETGELSRKQVKQLKRELSYVRTLERRYAQDGLNEQELAELRKRVEVVRAVTNAKRIGTIK